MSKKKKNWTISKIKTWPAVGIFHSSQTSIIIVYYIQILFTVTSVVLNINIGRR